MTHGYDWCREARNDHLVVSADRAGDEERRAQHGPQREAAHQDGIVADIAAADVDSILAAGVVIEAADVEDEREEEHCRPNEATKK